MNIIWYNSELMTYRYGNSKEFVKEVTTANRPSSLSILMKFNAKSDGLANKVLKQLNLVNTEIRKTTGNS